MDLLNITFEHLKKTEQIEQASEKKTQPSTHEENTESVNFSETFDESTQALVDWFYSNFDKLPHEQFELMQGNMIECPGKWYKYLSECIDEGPNSVHCLFGALNGHLKKLKQLFDVPLSPTKTNET